MAQPFSEERLDLGYDYGAIGGHRWRTTIVEHGNGNEQRNSEWSTPLGRWSIGDRSFYLEAGDPLAIKDFFEARRGSYEGFRWRDWSDYQAVDSPIGVGNGVKTQFQVVKRYTVGGAYYDRIVSKPLASGFAIKVNNIAVSDSNWTLDSARGLVSFFSPPVGTITASFEFDVPVVFTEDSCTLQLKGAIEESGEQIWSISSLSVEELRVPPAVWVSPGTLGTAPGLALDLGIFNDTNYELNYQTVSFDNAGGWRSPLAAWTTGKQKLTFDRLLNREELTILQNYFWVCHGSHHPLTIVHNGENLVCRFIDDTLSTQFMAMDDREGFWKVSFRLLVLQ